jgi:hypothetical protein
VGRLAQLFVPAAVVITAYLAANQHAFGTALQVSGLVKRAPLTAATMLSFAVFVALALAVGVHTFRRDHGRAPRRTPRFPQAGAFVVHTGWFGAFCILVLGYYEILQTQRWLWYWCPLVLYGVIVLLLAVVDLLDVALAPPRPGRSGRPARPAPPAARALAPLAVILGVPLLIALVVGTVQFRDPTILSIQQANRDAGEWIAANLPPGSVVASWDAGVNGYFGHVHTVNVDGVVNSLAYQRAMDAGSTARELRCDGVAYVANHGPGDTDDDAIRALIRDLYGTDASTRSQVIELVPFDYSGTLETNGAQSSGQQHAAVRVYAIPADAVHPRPDDHC